MRVALYRMRWYIAVIIVLGGLLGAAAQSIWPRRKDVTVNPDTPQKASATLELPSTASHLSATLTCPATVIATQLEAAVPGSFHFDVNSGGVRAYGTPGRGPITVTIDPAAKRVSASTPVTGRVQVETKVLVFNVSVGIDVSGGINASMAPEIAPNWTISPHFDIAANVNRAAAKTAVGDIDVTGHVRGPVGSAVNGVKAPAEAKLVEALDVRRNVEHLWNEINSVHKLAENPPTWLRITPRHVAFPGFQYTSDEIDSGLALDMETRVFIQDTAPEKLNSPLPPFEKTEVLSDEFELSIPVEVTYAVLNQQLKANLPKKPIGLGGNASVSVSGAKFGPYGDRVLLTVEFNAKKGRVSASGRLYFVGVPEFDAEKQELRVEQLDYHVDTRDMLLTTADWLVHDTLLASLKRAAVIGLEGELLKAIAKANAELDKLKAQLPKEVGANVSVTTLTVERLAFANDRPFTIIKARGKMSATLGP